MGRKSKAKMNRLQNKFKILEFPDGNTLVYLLFAHHPFSEKERAKKPKIFQRSPILSLTK
jgi:hypothetical protein